MLTFSGQREIDIKRFNRPLHSVWSSDMFQKLVQTSLVYRTQRGVPLYRVNGKYIKYTKLTHNSRLRRQRAPCLHGLYIFIVYLLMCIFLTFCVYTQNMCMQYACKLEACILNSFYTASTVHDLLGQPSYMIYFCANFIIYIWLKHDSCELYKDILLL